MKRVIIEKEWSAIPSAIEMEVVDILVTHNVAKKRIVFFETKSSKGGKNTRLKNR